MQHVRINAEQLARLADVVARFNASEPRPVESVCVRPWLGGGIDRASDVGADVIYYRLHVIGEPEMARSWVKLDAHGRFYWEHDRTAPTTGEVAR